MEDRKVLKLIDKSKFLIGIVLVAVFARLLPHPPNFTPIGGLALFSGATLGGFSAFIIPVTAMFVSDIFLGFHPTMSYVYISFILIVFIGKILKKNRKFSYLLASSLLSSILFFLITNFGVWFSSNMYTKNFNGLIQSYIMGIPFFRNTILGDLFYTFALFYGFFFIINLSKKLFFVKITTH